MGTANNLQEEDGTPKGNRTPVSAVRGRRPRPLDDGSISSCRDIDGHCSECNTFLRDFLSICEERCAKHANAGLLTLPADLKIAYHAAFHQVVQENRFASAVATDVNRDSITVERLGYDLG